LNDNTQSEKICLLFGVPRGRNFWKVVEHRVISPKTKLSETELEKIKIAKKDEIVERSS